MTSSGQGGETVRTSIIANEFIANVHPIIFTSIGIDALRVDTLCTAHFDKPSRRRVVRP